MAGGRVMGRGLPRGTVLALAIVLTASLALAWPSPGSAATPKTITIGASAPSNTGNCWPFGEGDPSTWPPYFGFVYMNLPAFDLKAGDTLAFDLANPNDADIQLDIAMAPAANGTDTNTAPFTTIVRNTQTPANPRGDATVNDYELAFTAQAPFSFGGGGLIIRISNPGPALAADSSCADGELVGAQDMSDPSGFFVHRVFQDADGVAPWDNGDSGPIAQFRLVLQPTPNAFSFGKLIRHKRKGTATLPVTSHGPGTFALSGKGIKPQVLAENSATKSAGGTVNLLIKPKGKLKRRLVHTHRAKAKVSVTFTPGGNPAGDPSTQKRGVKLLRAR